MADDNISTAEEGSDVRPGITFFKARGLKGRVKEVDIKSFDDILAYTETYEDLLFFKHLIQYYMNRIKKTNVVEKDIEMFTNILDKVNKKLNSLGLLPAAGFGVPQDHQIALLYFKKAAQVEPMPYRIL